MTASITPTAIIEGSTRRSSSGASDMAGLYLTLERATGRGWRVLAAPVADMSIAPQHRSANSTRSTLRPSHGAAGFSFLSGLQSWPVERHMSDVLAGNKNQHPTTPDRVRAFAIFFKNYMSVSALVVAALPIPVTYFQLIPTPAEHTKVLSVLTPLFCFLTLAYVFYRRHHLASAMFFPRPQAVEVSETYWAQTRERIWRRVKATFSLENLPLVLILASLMLAVVYLGTYKFHDDLQAWNKNAEQLNAEFEKSEAVARSSGGPVQSRSLPLYSPFWASFSMLGLYLGMFLAAEAAFVLMAIREYLQDVIGLSEMELIAGGGYRANRPSDYYDSSPELPADSSFSAKPASVAGPVRSASVESAE